MPRNFVSKKDIKENAGFLHLSLSLSLSTAHPQIKRTFAMQKWKRKGFSQEGSGPFEGVKNGEFVSKLSVKSVLSLLQSQSGTG